MTSGKSHEWRELLRLLSPEEQDGLADLIAPLVAAGLSYGEAFTLAMDALRVALREEGRWTP